MGLFRRATADGEPVVQVRKDLDVEWMPSLLHSWYKPVLRSLAEVSANQSSAFDLTLIRVSVCARARCRRCPSHGRSPLIPTTNCTTPQLRLALPEACDRPTEGHTCVAASSCTRRRRSHAADTRTSSSISMHSLSSAAQRSARCGCDADQESWNATTAKRAIVLLASLNWRRRWQLVDERVRGCVDDMTTKQLESCWKLQVRRRGAAALGAG